MMHYNPTYYRLGALVTVLFLTVSTVTGCQFAPLEKVDPSSEIQTDVPSDTAKDSAAAETEDSPASADSEKEDTSPTDGDFTNAVVKLPPDASVPENGVYTGYTVNFNFACPYYPDEEFEFSIRIPQIRSDKPNAVSWNEKTAEATLTKRNTVEAIARGGKIGESYYIMNVWYETFNFGSVRIISERNVSGILGTGMGIDLYDIYYYDTATDIFLTKDEFIRLYTGETQTLSSLLDWINELPAVKQAAQEGPFEVNESGFYGILPSEYGEGHFDVIYQGYCLEGVYASVAPFTN